MSEKENHPRRWRVRHAEKLLWRTWHEKDENGDYLTLLYHSESDDTHLLNAVGAGILQILLETEASEEEILHLLENCWKLPLPDSRDVEHFLSRMTHTGILEETRQET
ncbi:MAG: HPr-rel-A system PqqD family peptide chaperone [Planctomycetia bacterium]|nr:HPr-rel-A system PqqD family peptide chaperone [Planctomycetia bacterium]